MSRITKSALLLWAGDNKKILLWLKHVIMPAVPLLWGMVIVFIVPLLPPELIKYAEENSENSDLREWLYYLAYGALVGQFSSYLHDRVMGLLKMRKDGTDSFDDDKTPTDPKPK